MVDEVDLGDSITITQPTLEKIKLKRLIFEKSTQIAVLSLLLGFIIVLILFEEFLVGGGTSGDTKYFDKIIPIIIPIFTYILGMKTKLVE